MALQSAQGRAAYQVPKDIRKQDWARKRKRSGFKIGDIISSQTKKLLAKRFKL